MIIACDVDATLDCSDGPVPVPRLRELALAGYTVVIVSASAKRPPGFIEILSGTQDRRNSLEEVKRRYPQEILFLYLSDNPNDEALARELGYCYIHPKNFR